MNKFRFTLVCLAAAMSVSGVSCANSQRRTVAIQPPPREEWDGSPGPQLEEPEEVVDVDYAALEKAQAEYNELALVLEETQKKRRELLEGGFDSQFAERFNTADIALRRALDAYGAGFDAFTETALNDGIVARDGFKSILDGMWKPKAQDSSASAAALRQQALNLKADVALKENYSRAVALQKKGDDALKSEDYRTAANSYGEAVSSFTATVKSASEKRSAAEAAVKTASDRLNESEKIIEEAVKLLERAAAANGRGDIL